MHRSLTGSRLVTLKNAFQHGVYFAGSACADSAVNRYLLDGTLPATNLTCTRDRTTAAASRAVWSTAPSSAGSGERHRLRVIP